MRGKPTNYIKITSIFTKSTVIVSTMIFFIDMILMMAVTTYRPTLTQNPAQFTNSMSKYIEIKNNKLYVNESGKEILRKQNAWIQIVDDKLTEVFSYKKPSNVPMHYCPIKFVHVYKYDTVNSTLFIGEKEFNNGNKFSYFVGFPLSKIAKYNIEYNPSNMKKIIGGGILLILAANFVIILIFGYVYFARKLGKPLEGALNYIEKLSNGNYKVYEEEKGIYKYVFKNLNTLSKTLMENRNRKKKLDIQRDEWIASISHDMKTPLSSIKGFSEILKDDSYEFEKDEVREYTNIIYEKSVYMEELINDLNLSYKLRNNCIVLNKEKVCFNKWIKDIVDEFHSNPEFADRNVEFSSSNFDIFISVDKLMVKRAFTNVITNFLMYNDNTSNIYIKIDEENGFLKTCIRDNGNGISDKDIEHIFERYYRGTNTTSNPKGSGLGMAIANDIIKLHNGFCDIKSKEGEGTILNIYIKES